VSIKYGYLCEVRVIQWVGLMHELYYVDFRYLNEYSGRTILVPLYACSDCQYEIVRI